MEKENEYSDGDTVWYIGGYRGADLILIRCIIDKVEDYFRRHHPDGRLFYWLDEPVGHAVPANELFDTKEAGLAELQDIYAERLEELSDCLANLEPDDNPDDFKYQPGDLQKYRELMAAFIQKTHGEACECGCKNLLSLYKSKIENVDWFNPTI